MKHASFQHGIKWDYIFKVEIIYIHVILFLLWSLPQNIQTFISIAQIFKSLEKVQYLLYDIWKFRVLTSISLVGCESKHLSPLKLVHFGDCLSMLCLLLLIESSFSPVSIVCHFLKCIPGKYTMHFEKQKIGLGKLDRWWWSWYIDDRWYKQIISQKCKS